MARAVLEPAIPAGKPKKLLDQIRDVRKTRARFQASEANVVEAFAAANACSCSVPDTTPINREQATATARLLANIGRSMGNIERPIRIPTGFSRDGAHRVRNEAETPQRLTQTPYSSYAWARHGARFMRNETGVFHYKARFTHHEAGVVRDNTANLRHEVESTQHDIFFPNVMFCASHVEAEGVRVEVEDLRLDVEFVGWLAGRPRENGLFERQRRDNHCQPGAPPQETWHKAPALKARFTTETSPFAINRASARLKRAFRAWLWALHWILGRCPRLERETAPLAQNGYPKRRASDAVIPQKIISGRDKRHNLTDPGYSPRARRRALPFTARSS